jgi:hypothetical protein
MANDSGGFGGGAHGCALLAAEFVHDDDIAGLSLWMADAVATMGTLPVRGMARNDGTPYSHGQPFRRLLDGLAGGHQGGGLRAQRLRRTTVATIHYPTMNQRATTYRQFTPLRHCALAYNEDRYTYRTADRLINANQDFDNARRP